MMLKQLKPVLVLTVFLTIMAGLLIAAKASFAVDQSILTDALKEKCSLLAGGQEYAIVSLDWDSKPKNIVRVIRGADGTLLFEAYGSGYAKNGVDALVLVSGGKVGAVTVVGIPGETPGFGDRVMNDSFLNQFFGKSTDNPLKIAKNDIDAVTGATKSSKGVTSAVNNAVAAYKQWISEGK